ncbi:MAG: hypothetical protein IJ157_05860 [Clostridia bacterium]|nr:hypothetical protein [Clostridia bacterium]
MRKMILVFLAILLFCLPQIAIMEEIISTEPPEIEETTNVLESVGNFFSGLWTDVSDTASNAWEDTSKFVSDLLSTAEPTSTPEPTPTKAPLQTPDPNTIKYFFDTVTKTGVSNGYSGIKKVDSDDPHYGWKLGRFCLNGFTRVIDDTNGNPVFLKVVGDKISLRFYLEQDIDRLNEKEGVSIASDAKGYDENFGIPKTDFKRGALIIRQKTHENYENEPILYTDFLSANEEVNADTMVEFLEEGDYEVALDYEIKSPGLLGITTYNDYRIYFKFSVRNGNCMVYPFDVVTGAELQNTAITENGFYLDLARSRYLDINVKRSVLQDGAGGIIEDDRFNRPAKDGDRYTTEGIYTVSVKNRYTGESTVKTIFVGTDELLRQYVANGFSVDRLK